MAKAKEDNPGDEIWLKRCVAMTIAGTSAQLG